MQFIISKDISEETYNMIVEGYQNRELIEKELINSLDENLCEQDEQRMSNLAYLIEHGYVDLKINNSGIRFDSYPPCLIE